MLGHEKLDSFIDFSNYYYYSTASLQSNVINAQEVVKTFTTDSLLKMFTAFIKTFRPHTHTHTHTHTHAYTYKLDDIFSFVYAFLFISTSLFLEFLVGLRKNLSRY